MKSAYLTLARLLCQQEQDAFIRMRSQQFSRIRGWYGDPMLNRLSWYGRTKLLAKAYVSWTTRRGIIQFVVYFTFNGWLNQLKSPLPLFTASSHWCTARVRTPARTNHRRWHYGTPNPCHVLIQIDNPPQQRQELYDADLNTWTLEYSPECDEWCLTNSDQ